MLEEVYNLLQLGVSADEIALVRNTSEANNTINNARSAMDLFPENNAPSTTAQSTTVLSNRLKKVWSLVGDLAAAAFSLGIGARNYRPGPGGVEEFGERVVIANQVVALPPKGSAGSLSRNVLIRAGL